MISRAIILSVTIATVVNATSAKAQTQTKHWAASKTDISAVRSAARDYIEGFYEGDTTKLVRSVAPEVFKYGYDKRPDGYKGMAMSYGGFMSFARGVKQGKEAPPPNAPRDIILLDVQDQIANVKVIAWWGIDYLLLAKRQ